MYTGEKDYFRVIKGDCFGLGLSLRDKESRVIIYTMLTEDDGCYFESTNGWSTYWLSHHVKFMGECLRILKSDYPRNSYGEFYLPESNEK